MTDFNTVTEGGATASSNSETPEQLTAILSEGKEAPATSESEAGSILGKKGGEAAAAKRAEAAKETAPAKEADGANAEPDKPASEEPERPLGKPRGDPRARMLEATRQAAEAKRERDAIRAEKDRLASELESLRSGKAPEAPKATPGRQKPKLNEFLATHENYDEAVEAYVDARDAYMETERREQAREQAYHAGITEAVDSFTKRMDEAETKDPEYNSKVAHVAMELCPSFKAKKDGIPLGPIHVITDEIINSEHAPALTLHLSEHPEEFQRLKALRSPLEVQLAMAKLEAKIEARLDAAPQATALRAVPSQAKPPLRPVNGSPHTADTVPGEGSSYDEYKSWRIRKDKELQARR